MANHRYTADRARRLAIIYQLNAAAREQAEHPEPLCCLGVLAMHDAAELFLVLTAEATGANIKASAQFLEYWDPIDQQLAPEGLGHKASMRTVSDARRGLKHSGILPSRAEVQRLARATSEFLEDATTVVFDIPYERISLSELIVSTRVRTEIEEAEHALGEPNAEMAMQHARLAFEYALRDDPDRMTDTRSRRQLRSPNFDFYSAFHLGLRQFDQKWGQAWDQLIQSVQRTESALRLISHGINYEEYLRFDSLAPHAVWTIGRETPVLTSWGGEPEFSMTEAQWCVDFVTKAALSIQS